MLFSGAEWTTLGGDLGVVLVVLAAVFKFGKKEAEEHPQAAAAIEHELPHGVVTAVEDVGKFVENIAASPFFAGIVAKGKLESQHVLGQLSNSQAATVASQVLHAIGNDFSSLSPTDQNFAIIMARTALSKVAPNITDAQIKGLLEAAEEASNKLKATVTYKAMQDLKSVNTAPAEEAAPIPAAPQESASVAGQPV